MARRCCMPRTAFAPSSGPLVISLAALCLSAGAVGPSAYSRGPQPADPARALLHARASEDPALGCGVTELLASDEEYYQWFGYSVAISGDTALVGAFLDDGAAGASAGSAYVFVRTATGWTEQAKLTASDAAAGDEFGFSVSISGDTALIGAVYDDAL